VRRDNVEHLILIGGPSDVVVEQGIQRRRRPAEAQAGAANTDSVPTPSAPQENAPIPFPQVHKPAPMATPVPGASVFTPRRSAVAQSAPAPRHEEAFDMTPAVRHDRAAEARSEPAASISFPAFPAPAPQPAPKPYFSEPAFPQSEPAAAAPLPPPFAMQAPRAEQFNPMEVPPAQAPAATAPNPFATSPEETAAKVNDLEREMARLLGEITAKPLSR
jgi:hypothetical protein